MEIFFVRDMPLFCAKKKRVKRDSWEHHVPREGGASSDS